LNYKKHCDDPKRYGNYTGSEKIRFVGVEEREDVESLGGSGDIDDREVEEKAELQREEVDERLSGNAVEEDFGQHKHRVDKVN
jgi:hypothetical protein